MLLAGPNGVLGCVNGKGRKGVKEANSPPHPCSVL
jgi:hypothetical protein